MILTINDSIMSVTMIYFDDHEQLSMALVNRKFWCLEFLRLLFFGSTGCKFHHFQIFQKFLSAKINHDKCLMSPFWPGIVSYMEHDHYKGFLTSPLSLTPEIILTKTI